MLDKKRTKKKIEVLKSTNNFWKFFFKFYLIIKFSKIMIKIISQRNFN